MDEKNTRPANPTIVASAIAVIATFMVCVMAGTWVDEHLGHQLRERGSELIEIGFWVFAILLVAVGLAGVMFMFGKAARPWGENLMDAAEAWKIKAEAYAIRVAADWQVIKSGEHEVGIHVLPDGSQNVIAAPVAIYQKFAQLSSGEQPTPVQLELFQTFMASLAPGNEKIGTINNYGLESGGQGLDGNLPTLSSLTANMKNLLFIGPMGSGKTTSVNNHISDRLNNSDANFTIIDINDEPGKWAGRDTDRVHVYGGGIDLEAAWTAMYSIGQLIKGRSQKKRDDPYVKFDEMVVVVDEMSYTMTALIDSPEGEQLGVDMKAIRHSFTFPLLMMGRKFGVNVIWAAQTFRAEALGLKGNFDLTDAFHAIVRTVRDPKSNEFWTEVESPPGSVPVRCSVPAFRNPVRAENRPEIKRIGEGNPELIMELPKKDSDITPQDNYCYEMYQRGVSLTEIGREVYGGGKSGGGEQNNMVRLSLAKFGINNV